MIGATGRWLQQPLTCWRRGGKGVVKICETQLVPFLPSYGEHPVGMGLVRGEGIAPLPGGAFLVDRHGEVRTGEFGRSDPSLSREEGKGGRSGREPVGQG